MKILYCKDCHGSFSLGNFLGCCPCGHCAGKQVQGTLAVVITGPAKVYALRNADLEKGEGKFWTATDSKDVYKVKSLSVIQRFADKVGKGGRT